MVTVGSREHPAQPKTYDTLGLGARPRAQLLHPQALHRTAQEGRWPVWEEHFCLPVGVWNLRSLGCLKLLPEADLSAGLLTNMHHLIGVTFAFEFHTHPSLWRERRGRTARQMRPRHPHFTDGKTEASWGSRWDPGPVNGRARNRGQVL